VLIRPDPTLVAAKAKQRRRWPPDWKPPTPEELRKGLRRTAFALPLVTLVILLGTLFVQSSSSSYPISGALATEVARGRHTATPQEFIEFALPYAQRAHATLHWPVSVILAQWGLEHGWRMPDFDGFNFGNEKAIGGEPAELHGFAYAVTPEDGLRQYLRVASLSFYASVGQAGGADAAARALGRSPWDEGHYTHTGDPGSSLLDLMRAFNLYHYDT
jgi:hypothetical protein